LREIIDAEIAVNLGRGNQVYARNMRKLRGMLDRREAGIANRKEDRLGWEQIHELKRKRKYNIWGACL
jgi:hypothetical protein